MTELPNWGSFVLYRLFIAAVAADRHFRSWDFFGEDAARGRIVAQLCNRYGSRIKPSKYAEPARKAA